MTKTAGQLLRFGVVGVAGLVVDVLVLYGALALGMGYFAGRAVSFLAAVWSTWQLNRRFTFAAGAASWGEWWRYLGAMLGGGAVNYAAYSAVIALVPPAPWLPLAGVCAGSIAGLTVNFLSAKRFVFRRP